MIARWTNQDSCTSGVQRKSQFRCAVIFVATDVSASGQMPTSSDSLLECRGGFEVRLRDGDVHWDGRRVIKRERDCILCGAGPRILTGFGVALFSAVRR
jgi:hypothetical protein